MVKVIERHGLIQRHACRPVGFDRSTLRYQRKRPDDAALRQRLRICRGAAALRTEFAALKDRKLNRPRRAK